MICLLSSQIHGCCSADNYRCDGAYLFLLSFKGIIQLPMTRQTTRTRGVRKEGQRRRRCLSVPLVLLSLCASSSSSKSAAYARKKNGGGMPLGPWSLPQVQSSSGGYVNNGGRAFLQECESFYELLLRMRGGSSYEYDYGGKKAGGGGNDYNRGSGSYNQDYGKRRDDGDDRYPGRPGQGADGDYYSQRGAAAYGRDDRGEEYYDYYDDRGTSPPRRQQPKEGGSSLMPSFIRNGNRQVGFALLGSGTVITMLGMSLFFNKTLMRLGNLLFIAGVPITVGPSRTAGYFFKPEKIRATACLGVGIFLVLLGNPVFGIVLEVFGLLNLFGNMFPVVMALARQMPVVGNILNGNNNNRGSSTRDRQQRDRRDDRYSDDYYGGSDDRGRGDDRYY